jgi:hypothetical protein
MKRRQPSIPGVPISYSLEWLTGRCPGKAKYPTLERIRLLSARGDLETVRDGGMSILPPAELERMVAIFFLEEAPAVAAE